MAVLVPLAERRGVVESELSEVPLSFYETVIEMPSGWCAGADAYVLLSEAYRDDARRASVLGWPVVERRGGPLDIVNDGEAIASILLDLVDPS